jgi:hypothetical protein
MEPMEPMVYHPIRPRYKAWKTFVLSCCSFFPLTLSTHSHPTCNLEYFKLPTTFVNPHLPNHQPFKPQPKNPKPNFKMRAAAVIAIFAATAMAQTGGSASPTTGLTNGTHTGKPTATPTSGASSLGQNILLGVGAAAVFAANL